MWDKNGLNQYSIIYPTAKMVKLSVPASNFYIMQFNPPLIKATLMRRYKRFLADVEHPDLGCITVHCPNTGSMKNCWAPGWTVWLLDSQNHKRKYRFTWLLAENEQGHLIGVNTHLANTIFEQSLEQGLIAEWAEFQTLKREVKYGEENSRIDFLIRQLDGKLCYLEVKSVTLLEEGNKGFFPDANSVRAQKHLRELMQCVKNGQDAALVFFVQHSGIESVSPAQHIDPVYTSLLKEAVHQGVKIVAYKALITPEQMVIDKKIPIIFQ